MKKLGKLSINPSKVIKNEELVNLKGGYTGGCCGCRLQSGTITYMLFAESNDDCVRMCREAYGDDTQSNWSC
jgi:natural product precursor